MGNRSNINLVGNTTQGQNVGSGEGVYKGKNVGNILQYKTLSVTGTTMVITSDADNIYFSAATGGGGGTVISGTATHIPVFNSGGDNVEDSTLTFDGNLLCNTGSGNMCIRPIDGGRIYLDAASTGTTNGRVHLGADDTNIAINSQQIIATGLASNIAISLIAKGTCGVNLIGKKIAIGTTGTAGFVMDCTTATFCLPNNGIICGAAGSTVATFCDAKPINILGGDGVNFTGNAGSGGDVLICGGNANAVGVGTAKDGGDLVFEAGAAINGGTEGRIKLTSLPACTTETDVVYIDASGNLSCGAGGGGGGTIITGTTSYIPVFNSGGDNIEDTTLTFASHLLTDSAAMCIKTTTGNIHLDARSDTNNGMVILGSADTPATATNQRICVDGLASNINMYLTPKGTGRLYAGIGYNVSLVGSACTGWSFGTNGSLIGAAGGQFYPYGGSGVLPDSKHFCIHGGSGYGQTGYNGNGGDLCLYGGLAQGTTVAKTGGDVVLEAGGGNPLGTAGRIKMLNLPACTTETCTVFIDVNGNLSTGVGSGGGSNPISGYTCATNDSVSIGDGAFPYDSDSLRDIAIGCGALKSNTSGDDNVGVGANALCSTTFGYSNVGIGSHALCSNTGGYQNVAVGTCALCTNGGGFRNTAIGHEAHRGNSVGDCNIALGYRAMYANSGSNDSVGIGYEALYCGGHRNVAIGTCTLRSTSANPIDNVAIGFHVMPQTFSGGGNVAIGSCAFCTINNTANSNTIIGACAGQFIEGACNVIIGYRAGQNASVSGQSCLIIANAAGTSGLIFGDFTTNCIYNGGDTASWDTTSDCRIKECSETITDALSTISALNPVSFDYTTGYTAIRNWDEEKRVGNHGFLAQEFETVFPKYVGCAEGEIISGSTVQDLRSINTGHLVPILVKAIQELEARIAVLEA